MKNSLFIILFVFVSIPINSSDTDWGFLVHRYVNRKAVFGLPLEMIPFFKKNIEYITEHSIDPDKRRYSVPIEAVRHYIDLEQVDSSNYYLDYDQYILANSQIILDEKPYSISISDTSYLLASNDLAFEINFSEISRYDFSRLFQGQEKENIAQTKIGQIFKSSTGSSSALVYFTNLLHGILPANLILHHKKLEKAFFENDSKLILRYAAELGHYIGDANVPLHTTENYNGQLTDQIGIHGFWETRVPELSIETYDFLIDKGEYIDDIKTFYWDIVMRSHQEVERLLTIEKQIRSELSADLLYCFDLSNAGITGKRCEDFAKAYEKALKGQVERHLRYSIRDISSAWYTAWVDAGQPILLDKNIDITELLQTNAQSKEVVPIRQHN